MPFKNPEMKKQANRHAKWKNRGLVIMPNELARYYATTHCDLCRSLLIEGRRTSLSKIVDHDHKTGKFRGVLCHKCNTGLSMLGDNVLGLTRALLYLCGGEIQTQSSRGILT